MEISLYRLRGVEKELKRLNANFELYLEHVCHITPHGAKRERDIVLEDTEVIYTNEEEDARRELLEAIGKMPKD